MTLFEPCPFLAQEDSSYAAMEPSTLSQYTLTTHIVEPVTGSFGKIAAVYQWIQKPLYFAAGDSVGDTPVLSLSKYKLWVARLEKPDYQIALGEKIHSDIRSTWLIQPTLYQRSPGFVPTSSALEQRLEGRLTPEIEDSLKALKEQKLLTNF